MQHNLISKLAKLALGLLLTGGMSVGAEPLKVAIIEALTGPVETVGRPIAQSTRLALEEINSRGGYNGEPIVIKEYDNASTLAGASEQFRAAVADGARIIFQAASSAVAGQLSDEVKRFNLRNAGKEIIFYNVGSGASDLTAEKCQFWFFRTGNIPEMAWNIAVPALQADGAFKSKAFLINQNYSYGLSVQAAQRNVLKARNIEIVGDVIHDFNKIQDFSPYVQQIKNSGAEVVLTGNGFNDLTLLLRAIRDAGLKVSLASVAMDVPGTLKAAGDSALGYYIVTPFTLDAGPKMDAWVSSFQKKFGRDPISFDAIAYNAVMLLGNALNASSVRGGPVDSRKIALAIENATYESPFGLQSMRKEDHHAIIPVFVGKLTRTAARKVDGTDMGFETVAAVSAAKAAVPVDPACKMQRPL